MSETVEVKTVVPVTQLAEAIAAEPNPVEEQAREQGWVSQDEWVKDGRSEDDWRPAKEFVERGEIFKSLHQVKRELKQTKAAHDALSQHHRFVYERAYQEAYNKLRQERRQALKDEDLKAVAETEEKIENLQSEHAARTQNLNAQQAAAAQATAAGIHPELQAFADRNPWYNTDTDMREFAEAVGLIYIQKNPNSPPADVLKHIESKVRKQYSEKFGQRKAAPNAVAGVDRTSQRISKGGEVVLDDMEFQIMKTLVANGDMTEDQYKTELRKAKGL